MVRRIFIALLMLGVLVALVPPFLTHGACTAEFDQVTEGFQALRPQFADLDRAQSYLSSQALAYQILSSERCLIWPEREGVVCTGGAVLLVSIPVKDRVCHYYRDRRIRLQIGFNSRRQLALIQTDMNPYQILKLPVLGIEIDWAK